MADPLATLHDLHLPFSMWLIPLCIGAILSLSLLIILMVRRWLNRTLPSRVALQELTQAMNRHHQNNDDTQLVAAISQLLRQFSQKRWPEADCTTLSGKNWLAFLESRDGTGDFIEGAGAVLAWRPYSATGEIDPTTLQRIVQRWLKENSL